VVCACGWGEGFGGEGKVVRASGGWVRHWHGLSLGDGLVLLEIGSPPLRWNTAS